MSKKDFLRGFGLGVLVTALILGATTLIRGAAAKNSTADSAKSGVSASIQPATQTPEETKEPTQTLQPTAQPTPEASQTTIPQVEATEAVMNTATQAPENQTGEQKVNTSASDKKEGTALVVVPSGVNSKTVADAVADAGLITDAQEFDSYLVTRGYSSQLVPGTYEIPQKATYEQIAQYITGNVK